MTGYIKCSKDGEILNINCYTAYKGLKELGFKIVKFINVDEIEVTNEDIVVSGIGDVRNILTKLGANIREMNYPEELKQYLGREIWSAKISEVLNNQWNLFIKPKYGIKMFTGIVLNDIMGLRKLINVDLDTEIWCSEIVNFVSEYRCFVYYGELIGMKHYKGDYKKLIDFEVLNDALKKLENFPKAFVMDFGVTDKEETLLVEVNDGYSVGCYGLESVKYARFLLARWSELLNIKDYFRV